MFAAAPSLNNRRTVLYSSCLGISTAWGGRQVEVRERREGPSEGQEGASPGASTKKLNSNQKIFESKFETSLHHGCSQL